MDSQFYHFATLGLFAASAIIFVVLFFVSAPYGRHLRPGWGPALPARVAWFVMEVPSPILFMAFYMQGSHRQALAPLILMALFMTHYIYRSVIYPIRMRGAKTKPVVTVLMAIIFNCFNGALNGWAISEAGAHLAHPGWVQSWPFVAGLVLFALGYTVNHHSDAVLRQLRREKGEGYFIPHGGLHRFVASPNYLGEIIEWGGFALAASTLPALAFFVFTIANLAPRSWSHLHWYRAQFDTYPKDRRALIPFVW